MAIFAILLVGSAGAVGSEAAAVPPTVVFDVSPNPATEGEIVTFDASGSSHPSGVDRCDFDFDGDGQYDESTSNCIATHRYFTPGTYQARVLVVEASTDERATATETVEVRERQSPVADFTYSPLAPVPGGTVTFDGSASYHPDGREIREYRWTIDLSTTRTSPDVFGLGEQFSTQLPEGNHEVTLEVFDNFKLSGSTTKTVEVSPNQPPTAVFSFSPTDPTVGRVIAFDATGSFDPDGRVVEYRWDFGDGDVRRTDNPRIAHSYDQAGRFTVLLTVTDDDRARGDEEDVVEVVVNRPPTAAFTATPSTPNVDDPVTFDASASVDEDGVIVQYTWEFGDGTTLRTVDPVVTHVYAEPGRYVPVLTVTDDGQATGIDEAVVTVGDTPNQPPTADFTTSASTVAVNETVTFDASASFDADGQVMRYDWEFGDGTTLRTVDPVVTHAYDAPGRYVPVLTVMDDDEATGVDESVVTVEEAAGPPVVRCDVSPLSVEPGETVEIDAGESDNVVYVEFDVDGDGTVDADSQDTFRVFHQYQEPGTYTPVVTGYGANDERQVVECDAVTVGENKPPTADFVFSPSNPIAGETVTFDGSASTDADGQVVQYEWDFDDASAARETDPLVAHEFANPGRYVVTLFVTDDDGATGVDEVVVEVAPDGTAPVVRCSVSPRTVADGDPVTIDATGSENVEYVEFDVDGDGTVDVVEGSVFVVEHTYASTGTYTPVVRGYAADQRSQAVECDTVTVQDALEPPTAAFVVTPPDPTTGSPATFDASASSDPDGTIVEYRWDFDGDGTVDLTSAGPVVEHTYSISGDYLVELTVVDDDEQTGTARDELVVTTPDELPVARCAVFPGEAGVGDPVEVDASESAAVSVWSLDADGDGTYDRTVQEQLVVQVSYEEPGVYSPRIQVRNEAGSDEAECGTVVVAENQPPVASFDANVTTIAAGSPVALDASGSNDPDGTIVEYQWDFDADGTVDSLTTDPVVVVELVPNSSVTVRLTVVDDDGATGTAERTFESAPPPTTTTPEPTTTPPTTTGEPTTDDGGDDDGDGDESGGPLAGLPVDPEVAIGIGVGVVVVGGAIALWLGRGVIGGGSGSPGGGGGLGGGPAGPGGQAVVTPTPRKRDTDEDEKYYLVDYAAGAFALPADGELVVDDVGFEPHLVALTASNGVRQSEFARPVRTDGWSYGLVRRGDGGDLTQHSVSVADDAASIDGGALVVSEDEALTLVADGEGTAGLSVRVVETLPDGFVLDVSGPGLEDDEPPVVLYRAYEFNDPDATAIGHFEGAHSWLEESEAPYDFPATSVSITAATLSTAEDAFGPTVGLSHGEIAGLLDGSVLSDAEEEDVEARSAIARQVAVGRVIDAGRANASATAADDDSAVVLPYPGGGGVAGRTLAAARKIDDGLSLRYDEVTEEADTVVSWAAMATGAVAPDVGWFRMPGPDEELDVDLGFRPGMVEFVTVDGTPDDETVDLDTLASFGWSHGTVFDRDGELEHYALHAADPWDGEVTGPAGVGLAVADGGWISGHDEFRVTATDGMGFTVETTAAAVDDAPTPLQPHRPLVVYKAWPEPDPPVEETDEVSEDL